MIFYRNCYLNNTTAFNECHLHINRKMRMRFLRGRCLAAWTWFAATKSSKWPKQVWRTCTFSFCDILPIKFLSESPWSMLTIPHGLLLCFDSYRFASSNVFCTCRWQGDFDRCGGGGAGHFRPGQSRWDRRQRQGQRTRRLTVWYVEVIVCFRSKWPQTCVTKYFCWVGAWIV